MQRFILLFLVVTQSMLWGQNPVYKSCIFQAGEELVYKVKWNFIRLGSISIRCDRDIAKPDTKILKLTMHVTSNPFLPFIRLDEYNETMINTCDGMSKIYFGIHKKDGKTLEISAIYDEIKQETVYTVHNQTAQNIETFDIVRNTPPHVDGPSLFFISRAYSQSGMCLDVPTFVEGKLSYTVLDFSTTKEIIELDGISGPVRVRKFDGYTKWKGGTGAGLTGKFSGWISDDEAAIPLRAEMKIFLGSVRLELAKYKRHGWKPPIVTHVSE